MVKVYNKTLNINEENIEDFIDLANEIIDIVSSDEDYEDEQVFSEIPRSCYPIPCLNNYLGSDVDIGGLELSFYLESLYEYVAMVADEYIMFSMENPYKTDYELLDSYNRFLAITEGDYAYDANPRVVEYFEYIGVGRLEDSGGLEFIDIDDSHLQD
jgi:hypothetical protein